jgi:signal transduction histidine kinase
VVGRERDAGPLARAARTVRTYLPRGNNLDEATFTRRHRFLTWVLGLHVPGLFLLGVYQGYDLWHVALELTVPVACVAFGRLAINRRLASFFITAGLVYCSVVLVHLSGGMIEAHFHFFILIGLIALYQDWVPFLWNVLFTVLSHGAGSAIAGDIMFVHGQGQNRPWTWAAIHGVAVLAACVGEIIFWKHTEQEQQRNVELVAEVASADAARQTAMSELLVNLARRNQSLLNRQLTVITDLELRERQPEVLEDLFRLDHLATRIRRNAESLLVLSGDEPARRWGNPVSLGDVVRAAAAEVEDYRRVDVLVNDHIEVEGRAVADLAHLLAELIENATTFSPPSSRVQVRSHLSAGERISTVISVEDAGLGMSDGDLHTANTLLTEAPEVDLGRSTTLGFHVVARLARRYGLAVRLAPTPGGGVTAMVTLPDDLVRDRPTGAPPPAAGVAAGADRYQRAAAVARGLETGPGTAGDPVTVGRNGAANGDGAIGASGWANGDGSTGPDRWTSGDGSTGPDRWTGGKGASGDDGSTRGDAGRPTPPLPRHDDNHVWHLPDIQPAVAPDALPAWRALPAAPPPPPPPPAAPTAAPPAAPEAPVAQEPDAQPAAAPPDPALGLPTPPDWWWESEAMLRGGDPGPSAGGAPTPAATPAGDPAPAVAATAPDADPATAVPVVPAEVSPPPLPALGDGLVRRVPGAHLAPSLRRSAGATTPPAAPAPTAAPASTAAGPLTGAGPAPAPAGGAHRPDREQIRSMLSRFQSSQRAGRAAVEPPADDAPQEKP